VTYADSHKLTVQFDKPGERKVLARFVTPAKPSQPVRRNVSS
jgi:hypothetical protein